MAETHQLNAPGHEATAVTTEGEAKDWLRQEAVGGTPFTATYLDNLRSLQQFTEKSETAPTELKAGVLGLAAVIGNKTENRLADVAELNGGSLPVEIEGIAPLHQVLEGDIQAAVDDIVPSSPEQSTYVDATEMMQVHSAVMTATEAQLNQPPRNQ